MFKLLIKENNAWQANILTINKNFSCRVTI